MPSASRGTGDLYRLYVKRIPDKTRSLSTTTPYIYFSLHHNTYLLRLLLQAFLTHQNIITEISQLPYCYVY